MLQAVREALALALAKYRFCLMVFPDSWSPVQLLFQL
jgi:hypothetical protein